MMPVPGSHTRLPWSRERERLVTPAAIWHGEAGALPSPHATSDSKAAAGPSTMPTGGPAASHRDAPAAWRGMRRGVPATGEDDMTDHVTGEGGTTTSQAGATGPLAGTVRLPSIPPADADRVATIGRATAAAAEALCKATAAAQDLGLPDPDGIGVVGLDYSALGEVALSLLVWAGALLEGAHTAASGLVVVTKRPLDSP
jgi:hypothetical protein